MAPGRGMGLCVLTLVIVPRMTTLEGRRALALTFHD